jgi:hypothetical protein
MKATARINTFENLTKLGSQGEALFLGDGSLKKDQEFYLYRGEHKCHERLLSFIQSHLEKKEGKDNWKKIINEYERNLVNGFLDRIEPFQELKNQYQWFCPPYPKTNSFWYLSVMQHFHCPTRLCDFTSHFWTAVFFACVNPKAGCDRYLYRLKCNDNDRSGNKLPKDSRGKAWSENDKNEKFDMNDLLGYKIEYRGFNVGDDVRRRLKLFDGTKKSQMYGWDTPYFKNARIQRQRGFFVYGVDVTTPLEQSIVEHRETEFQKYEISAALLPEITKYLEKENLIGWKVYLDLERAFEQLKDEALNLTRTAPEE